MSWIAFREKGRTGDVTSAVFARLMLVALILGPCSTPASAAPTTLTFSSNGTWGDGIAEDGEGGSVDIPGITIQVLNISDASGTNRGGIVWHDDSFLASNDDAYSALTHEWDSKGMAIRSSDGREFRITAFRYYNWGETESTTNTVKGYRNGIEVASTAFEAYDPSFLPMTVNLDATFDNVDEVRFYISAGGYLGDQSTSHHSINDIVIDDAAAPPVVTDANISISGASVSGGTYRIGDTVTATWNNTIGGDDNAGVTGVTVDFSEFGGGEAVVASESSGTWTAVYTIVSGAIDGSNRNVSVAATNAFGTTERADTTNASVDSIAPLVSDGAISISGASGTGGAYKIGDTLTATWNSTFGGDNNADSIVGVTVDFGEFGGPALAAWSSGGTWTASYTIVTDSIDAVNRNVSVTAVDNAGNTRTAIDGTNATVDNNPVTLRDLFISISGATGTGGTYRAGDTVTATWDNTAGGDNNADTIASVTADFTEFGGGAAVPASRSGGTWTATHTLSPGTIDATHRNVSLTATDNAGNATTAADTTDAPVDNNLPTITSVDVPSSGAYISGQDLDFTVNVDENVAVNTTGGRPHIALSVGAVTRYATYLSGSGTSALVFRHTIQPGDLDTDGIAVASALELNGGAVYDDAGQALETAFNSVGSTSSVLVDAVSPTVGSVSVPADGTYVAGEALDFTVNTDEIVTVNTTGGTPSIALTIGTTTRYAAYMSGSGTSALVFRYTVQTGDEDSDGIALSALSPNGGTLRDGAGNDANVTLNSVGATSAVLVDAVAPSGHGVSFDDDTINADEAGGIGFTFSGAEPGNEYNFAIASSGNGSSVTGSGVLVTSGQQVTGIDVSGLGDGTLTLSVTVSDPAGNSAVAVTDTATLDVTAPTVTSVTLPANSTYGLGQHLDLAVHFDEAVIVDASGGAPRLAVTIGAASRHAAYVSGSGTGALTFRYSVQNGDSDGDGITVDGTLDTNGGTIRDAAGNDAGTDLGTIGSLAGVLVDALDTDGDGVSDVQEGIDGTDPNDPEDYFDDTAPTLTAPDDVVLNATGLHTAVSVRHLLGLASDSADGEVAAALEPLASDDIDGDECCNPYVDGLDNAVIMLPPGVNEVTWVAADRKGNTAESTQTVNLRPLVSLERDQVVAEDTTVRFAVLLNGPSPFYPLTIPYLIDGASTADIADHDAVDGDVTFTETDGVGQTRAEVEVQIATDAPGEADETVIVRLDDQTPAEDGPETDYDPGNPDINDINSGVNDRHIITITEANIAPRVTLGLEQTSGNTLLVVRGDGPVTVTATVTDPNAGDTHVFDWSATDNTLVDTDGDPADDTLVFGPAGLDTGRYRVSVVVTDDSGAKATARRDFRVVTALPDLAGGEDSDGDGIDDATEGPGDANGNRIPDYLDDFADNVLPQKIDESGSYLVECEPGLACGLGSFAVVADSGGVLLTDGDFSTQGDLIADNNFDPEGGVFDFVVGDLSVHGDSVAVVLPQREAIPEAAVYRKLQGGIWSDFVEDERNTLHSAAGTPGHCPPPGSESWEEGLVAGYFCVQVTLEDGGPNDRDGSADGIVEDPGAVSAGITKESTPETSEPASGATESKVEGDGGGGAIGWLWWTVMAGLWLCICRGRLATGRVETAGA